MVKCNLCGKELKSLNLHLTRTHNMTPKEYRDIYPNAVLVDTDVSRRIGESNSATWTPAKRELQSKIMSDRMNNVILKDPAQLKRRSEVSRRNMLRNWESAEFSDTVKSAASKTLKKLWQDPEYRSRHIEISRSIALMNRDNFLERLREYNSNIDVIKSKSERFRIMNTQNWQDPEYRALVSSRSSAALSSRLKVLWKDPEYRQKMSQQSARTLASQGRLSEPHRFVSRYLTNLGVSHKNEYIISGKSFDIYLPEYNLAIEINGENWHGYHDTPLESMTEEQAKGYYRDMKRIEILGKENILFLWVNKDILSGEYQNMVKSYFRDHNVSYCEGI